MVHIQRQIDEVLAERRRQTPLLEERIRRLEDLGRRLIQLRDDVERLPERVRDDPGVRAAAAAVLAPATSTELDSMAAALAAVRNRMVRSTVNIGVSGQARTGKSTLLQAISGLDDTQIPVGSGLPVTAVRSRIFHAPRTARAVVTFHSETSFLRDVVGPYHSNLGLGVTPDTIAEFAASTLPPFSAMPVNVQAEHKNATMLQRLAEIKAALPSFRGDLVGGERVVDLPELRQYVAYPSLDEQRGTTASRRYLAVRDVRIETEFPLASVSGLGLVDLPGLGEVSPGAEGHHVQGLRNEVDFVILVKRPLEGLAFWQQADANAVSVLDEARGDIKRRKDFIGVLVNSGAGDSGNLVDALRYSLLKDANEGVPGRHFEVFECDARNSDLVHMNLMAPVLTHLAERLGEMDREVLNAAVANGGFAVAALSGGLDQLQEAIRSNVAVRGTVRAEVDRRADELHKTLAVELGEVVQRLYDDARDPDTVDPAFVQAVQDSAALAREWIEAGFGRGSEEEWVEAATRSMALDQGSGGVLQRELNGGSPFLASLRVWTTISMVRRSNGCLVRWSMSCGVASGRSSLSVRTTWQACSGDWPRG